MKYIDFESWTITWLHEGNVIVEDQLTHSGSRTARTTQGRILAHCKMWAEADNDSVLRCPDTDKQVYGDLIGWGYR